MPAIIITYVVSKANNSDNINDNYNNTNCIMRYNEL